MEGDHIIPLAVQPSFNHISESALARKLGLLQYSLNRSVSTGSVKLSVFFRALSLMGYTLEIKKKREKRWFPSGRGGCPPAEENHEK